MIKDEFSLKLNNSLINNTSFLDKVLDKTCQFLAFKKLKVLSIEAIVSFFTLMGIRSIIRV